MLVLPPSLASPTALLGDGGAHPAGSSEPLPTARIQQDPANAWMVAPDYGRPGVPGLGVSLPNCAAGGT